MRRAALFLLLFGLALSIRTHGLLAPPPTAAELCARCPGAGLLAEHLEAWRWVAAGSSALAALLVFAAFAASSSRVTACAAAVLAVLDPLALAAAREAGPGATLALASALLVLLALRPPRGPWRRAVLCAAAALCALPACGGAPGLPRDAVFAVWEDYLGTAGGALGVLAHHAGYALLPLALAGLCSARGRRLLPLLLLAAALAACADQGAPRRLATLAAFAPILTAAALLIVEQAARLDREQGRAPLAAFALVGLVVATQAPVLISDLTGGTRFPWRAALDRLERLERGGAPIYTTQPLAVATVTGREVRALPESAPELDALLESGAPAVLLLPLEGGALFGTSEPALLARIERRKVASFEVKARRLDLYRFEVRAFIFP